MTLNSEPKLTLVFNEVSPDSHAVDIVAVPGLGGIASWKPSTASSGHGQTDFWLCDWLPDDLPVSSIYVYEYPWAVFGGRSGIFKVAESLLDALKAARSKQKPRSFIFICHSLGGLIAKAAVLEASDDRADESLEEIMTSLQGIVFFGTPHSSSSVGLRRTLNKIGSAKPTQPLLATTVEDMQSVIKRFSIVVPHILPSKIFSFYEEFAPPGEDILAVDPSQMQLWNFPRVLLRRNHHNMCKFDSNDDPEYEKTLEAVQGFALGARKPDFAGLEHFSMMEQEILNSLDMGDTLMAASTTAFKDTCNWIFDHGTFRQWLRQPSKVLWISGGHGTGKTTLCKHLARGLEQMFPKSARSQPQLVTFGFSLQNNQYSLASLAKSALYQLLSSNPGLLTSEVLARFAARREVLGSEWLWDGVFLVTRLLDFIQKSTSAGSSFCFIVDALDESHDSAGVSDLLKQLSAISSSSGNNWVCASSRSRPVQPDLKIEIPLTDNNLKDIQYYVSHNIAAEAARCGQTPDPSNVQNLTNVITSKSSGIFLFASLLVRNACYRPRLDYVSRVSQLGDLDSFYETVLSELETSSDFLQRQLARKMLMIVLSAKRQLTIFELWDALGLHVPPGRQKLDPAGVTPELDPRYTLALHRGPMLASNDIAHQIGMLSGGLLAVSTQIAWPSGDAATHSRSMVVFAHESVRDYLVKSRCSGIERESKDDCNLDFEIAQICLAYIDSAPLSSWSSLNDGAANSNHFLQYAVLNVMLHLSSAGRRGSIPSTKNLGKSSTTEPRFIDRWIVLYKKFSGEYTLFKPRKTKAAHIMSYYGIPWLQNHLWGATGQDVFVEDHHGRTPLSFAAALGHLDLCRGLVDRGADGSHQDFVYGLSPLSLAASHGHTDIVRLLLNANHNVASGKAGRDAIRLSASKGHQRVLDCLLEHRPLIDSLGARESAMVLHSACSSGHIPVVSSLLDSGARMEHLDDQGWTALHHCISTGKKETLQVLIDRMSPRQLRKLFLEINKAKSGWVATIFRSLILSLRACKCGSTHSTPPGGQQSGKAGGTEGSSNDSGASKLKRRSDNLEPDSDEDDCGQEDQHPPDKRPCRPPPTKRFACPYYCVNPTRYTPGACNGKGFDSIHRLKQHLKRTHSRVEISQRCHVCKRRFPHHQIEGHECEKRAYADDYEDGYDAVQSGQLGAKSLNPSKSSGATCWRKIFKILFPNWVGELPSPYHEDSQAQDERVFTSVRKNLINQSTIRSIAESCRGNGGESEIQQILERVLANSSTELGLTSTEQGDQPIRGTPGGSVDQPEIPRVPIAPLQHPPTVAGFARSAQLSPVSQALGLPQPQPQPENVTPIATEARNFEDHHYFPLAGPLLNLGGSNTSYDGSMGQSSRANSSSGIGAGWYYPANSQVGVISDNTAFSDYELLRPELGANGGGNENHTTSRRPHADSGYQTPADPITVNTINHGRGPIFQDINSPQPVAPVPAPSIPPRLRQPRQRYILVPANEEQQQGDHELSDGSAKSHSGWTRLNGAQQGHGNFGAMGGGWPYGS